MGNGKVINDVLVHLFNEKAYEHHAEFHRRMTEEIMRQLEGDELTVLEKALTGLVDFFEQYEG